VKWRNVGASATIFSPPSSPARPVTAGTTSMTSSMWLCVYVRRGIARRTSSGPPRSGEHREEDLLGRPALVARLALGAVGQPERLDGMDANGSMIVRNRSMEGAVVEPR
jgi:hypothetical protein